MPNISWTFQFRWVLWGVGVFLGFGFYFKTFNPYIKKIEKNFKIHFYRYLAALAGVFFVVGLLAKYSQFWTLGLNSQDFWLFVDILEQMKKGGSFLTRFAPQGLGFIQHGAVHPMFSWGLLLPFAWAFGSVTVSLIYGPLVLSAAGFMLGVLARKNWGELRAFSFALAFLASTQLGKILMYDVHPEAAYPFAVLLWLWALGLGEHSGGAPAKASHSTTASGGRRQNKLRVGKRCVDKLCVEGKVRPIVLGCATLFCIGIKEDSFLILGPWIVWGIWSLRGAQRKAVIGCAIALVCGVLLQMMAVRNWVSGAWGPMLWEGLPVDRNAHAGGFEGLHWSGFSAVGDIIRYFMDAQGGLGGWIRKIGAFLVSRQWLSLMIFAPWVVSQLRFWSFMLPLVCVVAAMDGPSHLWNYYSAPFLGTFWFLAISSGKLRRFYPKWAVCSALILGSGSAMIFWPSPWVREIQSEVGLFVSCIDQAGRNEFGAVQGQSGVVQGRSVGFAGLKQQGGLVPSHLIGLVPLERVWTDRVPKEKADWEKIDFAMFSPNVSRFEFSAEKAQKLFQDLSLNPEWQQVDTQCRPMTTPSSDSGVVLFLRRSVEH